MGVDGLRMQGTTNQITLQFITKYDDFFLEDGELSPYSMKQLQVRKTAFVRKKKRMNCICFSLTQFYFQDSFILIDGLIIFNKSII